MQHGASAGQAKPQPLIGRTRHRVDRMHGGERVAEHRIDPLHTPVHRARAGEIDDVPAQ